mmetsp:Transcript_37294/g.118762  ORF Transcript_37294/g.118762 Transcript_37294/m.118762 type:complete len:119 (-) Transcript_37294:36-392(-)
MHQIVLLVDRSVSLCSFAPRRACPSFFLLLALRASPRMDEADAACSGPPGDSRFGRSVCQMSALAFSLSLAACLRDLDDIPASLHDRLLRSDAGGGLSGPSAASDADRQPQHASTADW